MTNTWVNHVKAYCKKHKCSYNEGLKKARAGYKKQSGSGGGNSKPKKSLDEQIAYTEKEIKKYNPNNISYNLSSSTQDRLVQTYVKKQSELKRKLKALKKEQRRLASLSRNAQDRLKTQAIKKASKSTSEIQDEIKQYLQKGSGVIFSRRKRDKISPEKIKKQIEWDKKRAKRVLKNLKRMEQGKQPKLTKVRNRSKPFSLGESLASN